MEGADGSAPSRKGYVVPDAFTHGTSAQRKRWFMNGFNSGQLSACDTFSAESL
jgi:predicted metalloprotease